MGSIISSACNSTMLSDVTQASCQFVLNGISGKTFDKIKWRVRVEFWDKDFPNSRWNIKLENISKAEIIFEENNWQPEEPEEGWKRPVSYNYGNEGTITENWVGDTLKLTATKQSGDTPKFLQASTITQTHYTD